MVIAFLFAIYDSKFQPLLYVLYDYGPTNMTPLLFKQWNLKCDGANSLASVSICKIDVILKPSPLRAVRFVTPYAFSALSQSTLNSSVPCI